MKKKICASMLSLPLLISLPLTALAAQPDYQLEQVLMMSRHNLRAPLANYGSALAQATAKSWPQWDVPGGDLTTKGGVLEVYMGNYVGEWVAEQGLVKQGECPAPNSIYAYANSLQRTAATAQFFVTGAFPGCDIPVHHQDKMGTMDPTFSPSITDESQRFQQQALKAMGIKAQQLTLKPGYELLEEVVDYKNSLDCKEKRQCDLTAGNDSFTANHGEEPHVVGPLSVGNSLVDAFTMQNYEGLSPGQVAWGKIKTDQQWREVSAVLVGYQDTLFTTPEVAQNVAAPLVSYIRHTLVEQDMAAAPKIILLVGHDSNIASLLVAMRFKPYQLPGQYEETPIGGQLMFQRWHDTKNNRELMKVEYVYQSTAQLRNGEPLSLRHPPQHFTMQLEGCPIDANGFCPWDKFAETFAMTGN